MRCALGIALVACLLLPACETATSDDGGSDDGEGWEVLVAADWEVAKGTEQNYCLKKTFDEDVTISSFEALAPPGTHHTVVTVGDPEGADGGPDGLTTCGSYEHHFRSWIYESGSDDDPFILPEGFAAQIKAGEQLNLNFHILNATDEDMTGTTGTRIKRIDPADVTQYAKAMFMGKVSLSVPPGESTHTGVCEMPDDGIKIIAVQPHMHSHATHQKVIAKSSIMGDKVILDEPFDFDSDMFFRMVEPEVPMARTDAVEVQCSYNNDTGDILPWGQSSWTEEMCFAAVYVYPAELIESSACAN
jgi:hypothetical protein